MRGVRAFAMLVCLLAPLAAAALAAAVPFVVRPDDLIENMNELIAAAKVVRSLP